MAKVLYYGFAAILMLFLLYAYFMLAREIVRGNVF